MNLNTRYMLIIACSQRKCLGPSLLPALERYNGGSYRLLRKARRDGYLPEQLEILILSAKYGLISASTPIANYEQRMSRKRALELHEETVQLLESYSQKNSYKEVYVDLGQDYYPVVGDVSKIFTNTSIICAQGKIGERLAKMKHWLMVTSETERTMLSLS